MGAWVQGLRQSFVSFPGHLQGAGLEVEKLGVEPRSFVMLMLQMKISLLQQCAIHQFLIFIYQFILKEELQKGRMTNDRNFPSTGLLSKWPQMTRAELKTDIGTKQLNN